MKLSYNLKVFANKGKVAILENLAHFWVWKVNEYIDLYWRMPDWELKLAKPQAEFRGSGSKLENLASVKAWQMVKAVRRKKKGPKLKPVLRKTEFELDETLFFLRRLHHEGIRSVVQGLFRKEGPADSYTGQKASSVKLLA